jgi:uncharacterized protein YqeY
MTNLYSKIKADQIQARKDREVLKAALLTTLMGEAQKTTAGSGQEPADDQVMALIKKFVKDLKEFIRIKDNPTSRSELEILEAYLPKQLTDEQLKAAVDAILVDCTVEGGKRMGYVMGQLKQQYPDQFDASKVKGLIS